MQQDLNNQYGPTPGGTPPFRGVPPTPGFNQPPRPGYDNNMGNTPVQPQQTNGMATAGFVLAIVTVFCGWLPFAGILTWILAIVFSAIGLGRRPRGLAIAGLIIALALPVLLIVLLVVLVSIGYLSDLTSVANSILSEI